MKSITKLSMFSLLSMLAFTASAEEAETRGKTEKCILQKVCSIDARLQCSNAISFGSADINKPGGYVITQPGVYCLKEDVVFNPTLSTIAPVAPTAPYDSLAQTTVQAAITIRSSNVVVLMGDHRLSQAGAGTSTQVPFVVGILIPDTIPNDPFDSTAGLQSIYIKGGDPAIIDGFSMYGIRIFGHNSDIRLSNLTVKNCGVLASVPATGPRATAYGFPYIPHNSTTVGYGVPFGVGGVVIGESASFGMGPVFFTQNVAPTRQNRLESVILDNVVCIDNYMNGLVLVNSTDNTINACHIDDTFSNDPGITNAVITNAVGNGTTVTYTYTSPGVNFIIAGQVVSIVGINPSQYNLSNVRIISTTPTTFTVASTATGAYVSGGNVLSGTTDPAALSIAGIEPIGAVFAFGDVIDIPGILNMTVNDSTFNRTAYRGDFTTAAVGLTFVAEGIHDVFSRGVTYTNCQMNATSSTFFGGGVLNYGSASNEDSMFINCSFSGGRALTQINGFHRSGNNPINPPGSISSRNTVLINCVSSDNQQIGDQQLSTPFVVNDFGIGVAVGFLIAFAKNVTMDGCVASDNIANGPLSASSICAGFVISDSIRFAGADIICENVVLNNCIAQRTLARNGGQAQGFRFVNALALQVPLAQQTTRAISVDNCVSSGNQTFAVTGAVTGVQGIANGYYVQQNGQTGVDQFRSWPISFTNSKAMRNKGPLSMSATGAVAGVANSTIYSAGLYMLNAQRHNVFNCEFDDNIYGVMLQQCDRCTVRECRSDNNTDNLGAGEGYTDLGPTGTPASLSISTSTFERNNAFKNGAGNIHDGTNGNYNIIYGPTGPREALLTGQLSVPNSYTATVSQPNYYAISHNLSVIQ